MPTIIKVGIGVLIFLSAAATQAAPFAVVDQATGASYQCGVGGTVGVPTTGSATNPQCSEDLIAYCYAHTSGSQDSCYQQIMALRGCALTGYSTCVPQTTAYCYAHTSMSQDQCFNESLTSCQGGSFSKTILDALAAQADKRASDKYSAQLQLLKTSK